VRGGAAVKTIIEPFKIKMIEPIKLTSRAECGAIQAENKSMKLPRSGNYQ
jgi:hypothetical protein